MKRQKMRTEQKSNVKNSVGRLVFVGLSLLLQVLWILLLFLRLNAYSTAISLCFSVGAFPPSTRTLRLKCPGLF